MDGSALTIASITGLDTRGGDLFRLVRAHAGALDSPHGTFAPHVCDEAGRLETNQTLLDHLREKLDVEPHETTDDGKFTLVALECLGACEGAPCCLVNDDRHDDLTIEKIDSILDNLPD